MSFLDTIPQKWWLPPQADTNITLKPQEQETTITNPFATKVKTTVKLDEAGNVPIANPTTSNAGMGLTIEKTATEQVSEKPFVKTGESSDERLTRYYGSAYTNASREDKEKLLEKYVKGHFETLKGKTKPERIQIQLTDYKKLLSNTQNPEEREMLAHKISVLEKENQVSAAKFAIKDSRTPELRHRAEVGIARAVHECDKGNQRALTNIVVQSGNEEAQKIGASLVSQINPENQNYVHKAYFDLDKVEIQKTLTQQLGQYDKNVQQSIYKRTMTSQYQEVLEFAAKNIYTLHKDNQVAATQMTVATKNEGAIRAAASNAYLCDKSNQAQIKSTLASSGYESVKQTLKEAERKQSTQAAQSTTPQKPQTSNSSVAEEIRKMINSPNKTALNKAVQKLSNPQKIALMSSLSSTELLSVLDAILADNPSSEVISKAMDLIGGLDYKNKEKYTQQLRKTSAFNIMIERINSIDPSLQVLLVKFVENLNTIDRAKLSPNAQAAYDERKEELTGKQM